MVKESYFQKKIISGIEDFGGVAINGIYSVSGEADLQCGIPWNTNFLHLAIEVKTKEAYLKLIKGLTIVDGLYTITDRSRLDDREVLQMHKLNRNRKLGGKALFAFDFSQVIRYLEGEDL